MPRDPPEPPPSGAQPSFPARKESAWDGFPQQVAVAVLIVALIGGTVYLLWLAINIVLIAFGGVLFGLFLSGLAQWLQERTRIRYGWALTIVVVLLVLLGAGVGWLIAARLTSQLADLYQTLPRALDQLHEWAYQQSWGRRILEQAPHTLRSDGAVDGEVMSRMTGVVTEAADIVVSALVILFVGLFVAVELELYKSGILCLTPPAHRRRVSQTLDTIGYNLRWWLVGQAVLMATMAVLTGLGLWLIGMPLPLALGLIAGILEMVPYLGPWLSGVPAALIALMISPWLLLMVFLLYLALHLLEGYLLAPLVQRRLVRLPPALTVIAQFLFAKLFGLLGMFLAAPLTVLAVVALKLLYVEDALGDKTIVVPGEPACE